MNFSVSKKDNSFYFHYYDDAIQKVKVPKTPLEKRDDGRIDFNDYEETEFLRNKISLHERGFIHSTDKNGNRLRDGIIGFSFDEIEISKLALLCAPRKIELLTPYKNINSSKDMIIHLPEDIRPFTLHFDIYRKSRNADLDISIPNLLFGGFIMTEFDNKEFGLRMYGQMVLGKPFWPPFNLILTRIKINKA